MSKFSRYKQKEDNPLRIRNADPSGIKGNSISLDEYRALKDKKPIVRSSIDNGSSAVNDAIGVNHHKNGDRKSKYNAKKIVIDGVTFDSKIEGSRYIILKERLAIGLIKELDLQKRFEIVVNGSKICSYLADFYYFCNERNEFITEDVKGRKLPVYRLKKKLLKAVLNIDIIEIEKDNLNS